MPAANDSPRVSYSLDTVNVANTGAGYTWNFSTLKSVRQTAARYLPASKTPYSLYFSKDIGQKVADSIGGAGFEFKNVYDFYKNTTASFSTVGEGFSYSGFPLASTYTAPDKIYIFPLTYGDKDSSVFKVSFSLFTLGGYSQTGRRLTVVDGYGSITTPYKTYDSCIRVHSYIQEVDSIFYDTLKIGVPNPHEEYKWLAHGEVIPVLEVDGNTVAGAFVPTNIIYRDSFRVSPLGPKVDFTANDTTPTTADTVTFTNNTTGAGNSYVWTITPATTFTYANGTTANSANPRVVFNSPGQYTVTLTATNLFGKGALTKTNYIVVSQASGIDGATAPANFVTIFPNPAKDRININFNQRLTANTVVEINAIDGRLIYRGELPAGSQQTSLNLTGNPAGNYLMTIISGEYKITKQFAIE